MRTGHKLKQGSVFPMYEEKLDQLSKSHQHQLHELQERYKRLEQEKEGEFTSVTFGFDVLVCTF